MSKRLLAFVCVILSLKMLPIAAFAGVTDTGNGNIIRTTTTNYFTTIIGEATATNSATGETVNFVGSISGEIEGNTSDAAVSGAVSACKSAITAWAQSLGTVENIAFSEGISDMYYEVHDEIVNAKNDNAIIIGDVGGSDFSAVQGTVTINTVLDKYQTYKITGTITFRTESTKPETTREAINKSVTLDAKVGEAVSQTYRTDKYGIPAGAKIHSLTGDYADYGLKVELKGDGVNVTGTPNKPGATYATIELTSDGVTDTLTFEIKIAEKEEKTDAVPEKDTYVFPFTDVKEGDWFYGDVYKANRMGLINGKTAELYKPNDNMTYAEAIKLAACMSQYKAEGKVTLKNGTVNWYDTYVDYAKAHGIPTDFADMNAKITREDFVHVFFHALPADSYKSINKIGAIPDVSADAPLYSEIMTFYSAGILTGSDAKGTFNPTSSIKRSEVAAIITRMMDASARKTVTLK